MRKAPGRRPGCEAGGGRRVTDRSRPVLMAEGGSRATRHPGMGGCAPRSRQGAGTPSPPHCCIHTQGNWTELVWPCGGVRGRERSGSTRSHPEPGRDPGQRRRVLRGRPRGRRGRCGRHQTATPQPTQTPSPTPYRGVEQRQLVGLITQRSRVRIPPPPLLQKGQRRPRCPLCVVIYRRRFERKGKCERQAYELR